MPKAKRSAQRKIISIITGAIVLGVTTFLFFKITSKPAQAAWYDDNWGYRQKFTLTSNNTYTSPRRVAVTIDTSALGSKILSTCNDARFTDSNGALLQYQLTSACAIAATTFDVVFPTLVSGTNFGYFYYGNPGAKSGSTTVSSITSLGGTSGGPTNVDNASDFGAMINSNRQLVRTSSGTLYSVLDHATVANLEIWKSTSGSSWALQDSAHSPVTDPFLNTVSSVAIAIDSTDIIHVVYQAYDGLTDYDTKYVTYNTATDLWGTPENIGTTSHTSPDVAIAIDSNNIPHIIYVNSAGITTYVNRIGGDWTQISTGLSSGIASLSIAINEDNIPEISLTSGDLKALVGNQNDTTSFTSRSVDATTNSTVGTKNTSIAIDSSGNTWITYVDADGTITLIEHLDADAWTTWQSAVADGHTGREPSLVIVGTDKYIFYQNSTDDVAYDKYTGSWGGETTLQTGTFTNVKAKWAFLNDNQQSTQIDYLYDDNVDIYWGSLGLGITPTLGAEEKGPGPISNWKMDEGFGTSTNDSTTTRNTAALGGSISDPETIEKQINIIDQEITVGGSDKGMILLDVSKYNDETIYFEVVGKVTSGTGTAVLTYDAGSGTTPTGGSTVTISTITATSFTQYRSASFTPTSGQIAYVSSLTGTGTTINSARIVIVQTETHITDTETQVEIGNNETSTATSATVLTNPKIYQYNHDAYNSGTVEAYFEATLKSSTYASSPTTTATRDGGTANSAADAGNGYNAEAWTNLTNGATNDTSYISITAATYDSPDISDVLVVRNFGFTSGTVPTDATIVGIRVDVIRWASAGSAADAKVQLCTYPGSGVPTYLGTNQSTAAWGTSDPGTTYTTFGATNSTWGASISQGLVVTADFAVCFATSATSNNTDVNFDHIRMDITYTTPITGTATATLYNKTENAAVTNGNVTANTTTMSRIRGSSALTTNWDTTNDDDYEVRLTSDNASATTTLANAHIIIQQTNASGVDKTESIFQYNNTTATDADTTYTSQNFPNELSKSNFTGIGTLTGYFESTLKTSNGTNAYFGQLDYGGGLGQVTATDTSYARKRSSDIWSSLPTATTDIDVQLKNASTSTTSSSNSWLIVHASGMSATESAGAPTWKKDEFCISGKCLYFDGSNDAVIVPNAASVDLDRGLATGFGFQGWVRISSLGQSSQGQIFSKGSGTFLQLTSGSTASLAGLVANLDLATTDATLTVADALTLNQWHFVSMGYTDDSDDEITIYVDGRRVGSSNNGSGAPASNNNDLIFGGPTNFNGFMDEVKIYNYEHSLTQVKTDFASRGSTKNDSAQIGKSGPISDGLTGYWEMDGDATDSSGNALTLTNNGTTTFSGGKFGSAPLFNGSSKYFSTATSISGVQSVSFWANPAATTDYFINLASGKYVSATSGVLSATGFTSPTIYVNGVQSTVIVASSWQLVTITDTAGITSDAFEIGRANGSYSVNNSLIDSVRVYNRALNPTEVVQLYNFAPGPVGYWKLDEKTGTTASDSSGNGYTSSAFTGNTTWSSGIFGAGLVFDGTDDVVRIPEGTQIDLGRTTDSYTVETWVYTTASCGGTCTLIAKYDGVGGSVYPFRIELNSSTKPYFQVGDGTVQPSVNVNGNTNALNDGHWHHVVGVRDVASDRVIIYIDGLYNNAATDTTTTTAVNDDDISLGNSSTSYVANDFNGRIDDVKIYNYARTPKQVMEDMNAGHPAGGSPIGSQVAYWKLDEQQGQTLNNSSATTLTAVVGADNTVTSTDPTWKTSTGSVCKINGCQDFDGTNDVDTITNVNAIDLNVGLSTGLAISAWVYPDTVGEGSGGMIFSKGANTYCQLSSTAPYTLTCSLDLGTDATVAVSGVIPTATWSHIVLTWTDDSDDEISLYVNGILRGVSTNGVGPTSADTSNLLIGNNSAGSATFDGRIDEFKVYGAELSNDEIKIDMNANSVVALGGVLGTQDNEGFGGNAPIGWWDLNENTGTSVGNKAVSSPILTFSGTGNHWAVGKIGSAGMFNGTDDYARHITESPTTTVTNFTLEAWVYPTSLNNLSMAVYNGNDSGGYGFGMGDGAGDVGNKFTVLMGSISWTDTGYTFPSTNTWYHLVMTRDATTSKFYVNGQQTANTTTDTPNVPEARFYIGAMGDGVDTPYRHFQGNIDEVKMYDYVRSQAQIAYDYNRGAPVAWYKFDECQGGTAHDTAPKSNKSDAGLDGTITIGASGSYTSTGTCSSGTSTEAWNAGTTGKFNSALGFDGTNDYVSIPDSPALNPTVFTVGAWIYPTALCGGIQDIVTKEDGGGGSNNNFELRMNSCGGISLVDVNADHSISTNGGTPQDTWTHVYATWDGTTGKVYLNGVLAASGTGMVFNTTTKPMRIGARDDDQLFFIGKIDDVRIYNYPLTANQIKQVYNNGAVTFGPATGSP